MNNTFNPCYIKPSSKWINRVFIISLIWIIHILSPAQCVEGDTVLCMQSSRFRVEVTFQDFVGNEYSLDGTGSGGAGTAVPYFDDTGFFWFYSPDNIEMIVRIRDGGVINGHFWVFAAATTNVEFTLTITDTSNGAMRSYFNPSGNFAPPIIDTNAFDTSSKYASHKTVDISQWHGNSTSLNMIKPKLQRGNRESAISNSNNDSEALYLMDGRFKVETTWRSFDGQKGRGTGARLMGDKSGTFWFFSEENIEMIVKVLDGSSINDNYWFFFSTITNVEFEITLTDTTTGKNVTYFNELGEISQATGDNNPTLMKHYYGVHVTSLDHWRQRIIILNNGVAENSFTFDINNISGEQVEEETFSVAPFSSKTLIMTGDPDYNIPLEETQVITTEGTFTIHTDSLDLRPVLSYQYENSLSLSDFFLQSGTHTEYLLPNRVLDHFDWTGIAVMNSSGHPLELTVTAYKNGTAVDQADLQISPHSKYVDITQNIWSGLDYTSLDQIKITSNTISFPPPILITGNDEQDRHIFFNGVVTGTENIH